MSWINQASNQYESSRPKTKHYAPEAITLYLEHTDTHVHTHKHHKTRMHIESKYQREGIYILGGVEVGREELRLVSNKSYHN